MRFFLAFLRYGAVLLPVRISLLPNTSSFLPYHVLMHDPIIMDSCDDCTWALTSDLFPVSIFHQSKHRGVVGFIRWTMEYPSAYWGRVGVDMMLQQEG